MKKQNIALLIAGVLASGSTFAAEIYNADGKVLMLGGGADLITEISDGNTTSILESNINLDGTAKVSESITALGFVKYRFDYSTNETKTPFVDRGFVGLKGDFGKVVYGKADGAFDAPHFSDVMVIGSDAISKKGSAADGGEAVINYSLDKGPFSLAIAHQLDTSKEETKNGTAASVKFSQEVFAVAASYGVENMAANETLKQSMVGGSLTFGSIYVGATYNVGNFDIDTTKDYKGYELATKYSVTDELTLDAWIGEKVEGDNDLQVEGGYGVGAKWSKNGLTAKAGYKKATTDTQEDVIKLVVGYSF